jgi:hypothetical protein
MYSLALIIFVVSEKKAFWYFEPHGKLNPGSIYIHGILNPLIEN